MLLYHLEFVSLSFAKAGHPDATDLTRDFSFGNSDAMDILTLEFGLGLRLGRVLGLELGCQDVPGLKNTGVNFLASDRSRQDVADPSFAAIEIRCIMLEYIFPIANQHPANEKVIR